jgi:TonB family protein
VREVDPQVRRGAPIVAVSLLAHLAALMWLDVHLQWEAPAADAPLDLAVIPASAPGAAPPDPLAGVVLIDEDLLGPLLAASPGPADQAGFQLAHPLPSASVDLPGTRAAGRGGGAAGGLPSFTGRRDRDQLRSQIWNGLQRYQVPHQRNADKSSTPEALARLPKTGFDARQSRATRARDGAPAAQRGQAGADGTGGRVAEADQDWRDSDPRLDTGPTAHHAARQDGSTSPGEVRPLVDRGAAAVETERIAAVARDDASASAASSELDPMPLELTAASAGGRDSGVRGERAGQGAVPGAPRADSGTAATRADLAPGSGTPALRAQRQDPYFRRMYERLDSIVVYPPKRALALDQGEVIVAFTLFANGSIGDIRVLKSSGFDEFDDELTRAIRVAAPFGPVPLSLRGRSDRVGVTAPYKFSSPLIR